MKPPTIIGLLSLSMGTLFSLSATSVTAANPAEQPLDFKEVFDVLRTNLPGIDEQELNRAAARGLISQLRPKVTLAAESQPTNTATNITATHTTIFEKSYAYVRPGQVTTGSDKKFADALARLNTNRLKGIVLDLRFSGGEDYAAAAGIADRFFSAEQPLIDYGDGLKKSVPKENAISVPVAMLVNAKTVGASEALAGILRHNDVGLLLGGNTGGQANIAKTVTLATGQTLRIATIPVKTGNGNPLPVSGLKPDITIEISPDEDLGYVEEAYKEQPASNQASVSLTNDTASASGTNRSPRRRINEAELVRMLRDGQIPDLEGSSATPRRATPPQPAVPDPVLARALDLLKGLAVVQQSRSL